MSNVVAPTITPNPLSPFEQAVIKNAVKKVTAGPAAPLTPPVAGPPQMSPMPAMPAAPKFNGPVPGAAPAAGAAPPPSPPNPGTPPVAPPPGTPDLTSPAGQRAEAAAQQARDSQMMQQGLAKIGQPAPQPIPYEQPAAPPRNKGQDIGNVLGALLFRHAAPAFAQNANKVDTDIDKQNVQNIAAEHEKVDASQRAAQLAQSARANEIQRLQAAAAAGDKHAEDLLKQADIGDRNAALKAQGDLKLAQAATKIEDNRTKFAATFSGTMAKLGFAESKWGDQRALEAAKQAATDTYRYKALGLRTENAYSIAQLRAASQMTIDASRMADQDKRANATNTLRADLAKDHDLQQTAMTTVRSIDSWTKATMLLPPAQRAAAIAQMDAQMQDPNSPMGKAMAMLQRNGVYGDSVGGMIRGEIDSSLMGQSIGPGGQPQTIIDFHPTVSGGAAAPAAPAAPVAQPPAHALPPGAKVGTVHLKAGGDVQGYTVDGKQYFTMDGKPI